jgi:hypothetical protein
MDELYEMDEQTQAIIEALGTEIELGESDPQMLNIPRLLQMIDAFNQLRTMKWEACEISCMLHEPYISMGVISVETAEIKVDNLRALQRVLRNASNMEIYPLVNGNLKMNITFHGITKRIV